MTTTRQVVIDLMGEFLGKIITKPTWKQDDIVNEFYRAMYNISIDYLEDKEKQSGL